MSSEQVRGRWEGESVRKDMGEDAGEDPMGEDAVSSLLGRGQLCGRLALPASPTNVSLFR